MLWCIVSAGIFFLNTSLLTHRAASVFGFERVLQEEIKTKDIKEIPVDQKFCSFTIKEFAEYSSYAIREASGASAYALLMSLGIFVLAGIALFLQAVGKKKEAGAKPASSNL